jgi:hypothetical protein
MKNKNQIHNRLHWNQVETILSKYIEWEISSKQARQYLEIWKTRFFELTALYKKDKANFSIDYQRKKATRKINPNIKNHILDELKQDKEKIIDNPLVPTKYYNYSFLKNNIAHKYWESVSVPTVIKIAKEHWFYIKRSKSKTVHDRQVITNHAWELVQHDSSHHLFAPDAKEKWKLITSLDDYSRVILYWDLVLKESTWAHIHSTEQVCTNYWFPFSYYPDRHSIFMYVKDRDKPSMHQNYSKFTWDVKTQWEQVLDECMIKCIHALSAQAKWKIERPYRWLQDHLVRTCAREWITKIEDARAILKKEIYNYNYKLVHSTTKEIPMIRLDNAIRNSKSLFRPFEIPKPYKSVRDLFCLRDERKVSNYRCISFKWVEIKIPWVNPKEIVNLKVYPEIETWLIDIRIWYKWKLVSTQKIRHEDMPQINF